MHLPSLPPALLLALALALLASAAPAPRHGAHRIRIHKITPLDGARHARPAYAPKPASASSDVTWVHGTLAGGAPRERRPVVIWHGLGDSAYNDGMRSVAEVLATQLGLEVHLVAIGETKDADVKASYLGDATKQVATVCAMLSAVPTLGTPNEFDAIGFSQGGLMLRALIATCPQLRIRRLLAWASPNQGIADIPPGWCAAQPAALCSLARGAIKRGAYWPSVQRGVVPAAYFKRAADGEKYLRGNLFLPVVNNELGDRGDESVRERMASVEKLVLVKHTQDTVLFPAESAWFSELHGDALVPYNQTTVYTEDRLALRRLDERGDLVLVEHPRDHMQFSLASFLEVVVPLLVPKDKTSASPQQSVAATKPRVGLVVQQ